MYSSYTYVNYFVAQEDLYKGGRTTGKCENKENKLFPGKG